MISCEQKSNILSLSLDREPPTVDFCSSPPVYLVDNLDDLKLGRALVDWSDPVFHDNSRQPLTTARTIVTSTQSSGGKVLDDSGKSIGLFPIGETSQVLYKVTDASGNNASCTLNITLQGIDEYLYALSL